MTRRRSVLGALLTITGAIGILYTLFSMVRNEIHGNMITAIIMLALLFFYSGVCVLRTNVQ